MTLVSGLVYAMELYDSRFINYTMELYDFYFISYTVAERIRCYSELYDNWL